MYTFTQMKVVLGYTTDIYAFITVPEDLKPHLDSKPKTLLAEMKLFN